MVVIEQGEDGYGAYVPDLPGCVAAADTKDEVLALIQEAIVLHLELMQEDGLPIPVPHSVSEYVAVALCGTHNTTFPTTTGAGRRAVAGRGILRHPLSG